jgi:hypothetical protein
MIFVGFLFLKQPGMKDEETDWEDRDVYCFDETGPRGWWSKGFAIKQGWEYCGAEGIIAPEIKKNES